MHKANKHSTISGGNRNLQILSGLAVNKAVLSCSQDGAAIELWSDVGGAAGQLWDITPVSGLKDVFTISISGKSDSPLGFLGRCADGVAVKLWPADEGSGWQWWKIERLYSDIPEYYQIKIVARNLYGGLFLSSNPTGTGIELAISDDGSGRQRWQIQ